MRPGSFVRPPEGRKPRDLSESSPESHPKPTPGRISGLRPVDGQQEAGLLWIGLPIAHILEAQMACESSPAGFKIGAFRGSSPSKSPAAMSPIDLGRT